MLNELVQEEPASALDPEIAGQFNAIGITKFKSFDPDARMKRVLTEAVATGNAAARSLAVRPRAAEGFRYYQDPGSSWTNQLFVGGYDFVTPPPVITKEGVKPFPSDGARKLSELSHTGGDCEYRWLHDVVCLEPTITAARITLERGGSNAGDPTMLPATLQGPADEIARVFGGQFEQALRTLPVGGWQGPVRSGFGLHLVELRSRKDGRQAKLEDVREAVERDLLHARTREASAAFYERLRANYDVRIEDVSADAQPAG